MKILKKFLDCLFIWQVPPTTLNGAQAILVQAVSATPSGPGVINDHLARVAIKIQQTYRIPVVAQGETATAITRLDRTAKLVGYIPAQSNAVHYLDSHEVCRMQKTICDRYGWKRVVVIASKHHLWRVVKISQKIGFDVLIPIVNEIYEPESFQWWCRSKSLFIPHELAARLFFLWKGWI